MSIRARQGEANPLSRLHRERERKGKREERIKARSTSCICVRDFVSPQKPGVQRATHGLYEDFQKLEGVGIGERVTPSEERSAYARVYRREALSYVRSRRVAMNRRKVSRGDMRGRKYDDYTPPVFIFILLSLFPRHTFVRNWTCSMNPSEITCQFDLWRGTREINGGAGLSRFLPATEKESSSS